MTSKSSKKKSIAVATNSDELITLVEAADLFGLSVQYLRDIARSERLKAKKMGRDWVTTPADVETYLKSREKKGAYRGDIKT